jgi:hypothetical protein
MNAVDRFSNTLARYRQQSTPQPAGALPTIPRPVQSVQPPAAQQPAHRSEVDRVLEKVSEVTPILSRLAALLNRVQNPQPAVATTSPPTYPAPNYPVSTYPAATYPGTPPYVAPAQTVGQSLQRLGQSVGNRDVDTFVRQAAPVIDEALPLIDDIINLASGKPRQQTVGISASAQPNGTSGQATAIAQQVAPVVDGVNSLVTGVNALVKTFEGLFKR